MKKSNVEDDDSAEKSGFPEKSEFSDEPLVAEVAGVRGTLENGLRYYICPHSSPPSTAFVGLAVQAGSSLEERNEYGVAHMIEHLAFTSREGYRNNKAIKFLDTILSMGGACLNGETYYEYTSYQFSVTNKENLCSAIESLAEMCSKVIVSEKELERERGVVLNEYKRHLNNESFRLSSACMARRYEGSIFGQPLIGKTDVIETVSAETINKFYQRWYHLERMAIVVVGDLLDIQPTIELLRTCFGSKESKIELRVMPERTIPIFKDPRLLCFVDSLRKGEFSAVHVSFGGGKWEIKSIKDLRTILGERIFFKALQTRFNTISKEMEFSCKVSTYLRSDKLYEIFATCLEKRTIHALELILIELARIRLNGFQYKEIEHAKALLLKEYESSCRRTNDLGELFLKKLLFDDLIPDSDYIIQLEKTLISEISHKEVSSISEKCQSICNCCITTIEPSHYAKEENLRDTVNRVDALEKEKNISCDFEEQNKGIDVETRIVPGEIVGQVDYPIVGGTEFVLSNGMRVCWKTTDLSPGSAYLFGFAYGGLSEVPEADFFTCSMAEHIAQMSGIAQFEVQDVEDLCFSWTICNCLRDFRVQFPISHIEDALQLVHLLFIKNEEPKQDMLESVMQRLEVAQNKIDKDALCYFEATVKNLNGGGSQFFKSISAEDVPKLDLIKACQFANNCYRDPSSFVVVLVGDFNLVTVSASKLIKKYLGGIPKPVERIFSFPREELSAIPFNFPKDVTRMGIACSLPDSYCLTKVTFPVLLSNENMSQERYVLDVLLLLIRIVLHRKLRLVAGETYIVEVLLAYNGDKFSPSGTTCSMLEVKFSTLTANWKLVDTLLDEIEQLQNVGPAEEDILAVFQCIDDETDNKNERWAEEIACAYHSRDYHGVLDEAYEIRVNMLENLRKSMREVAKSALQKMLPFPCTDRYTAVILGVQDADSRLDESSN